MDNTENYKWLVGCLFYKSTNVLTACRLKRL